MAFRDWTHACEQIDAAALRRRRQAVELLAGARVPEGLSEARAATARDDGLEPLEGEDWDRVIHALEHEGELVLRRVARARPPAGESAQHDELVELFRSYLGTWGDLRAAFARLDREAARAAAGRHVRLNRDLNAATAALHERATG